METKDHNGNRDTASRPGAANLVAYEVSSTRGMSIISAPRSREWMDDTDEKFALRCLPLLIANQAGWLIVNPAAFNARWNGGNLKEDLAIEFMEAHSDTRVRSHFGYGILTFTLPYLFRTPKGVNLLVKGPSNVIKDGIQALEGIVETDWAVSSFTMNWKFTRPEQSVLFKIGEPICMIVPMARGLAEGLWPEQKPLQSDERLCADYRAWRTRRTEFLSRLSERDPNTVREGWQRDYFKGIDLQGNSFEGHQTQICLREFAKV